jgi:uncharacterized protein
MKTFLKYYFLTGMLILFGAAIYSQEPVNPDGYNIFYYPNGVKSSEGNMVGGKPDGYWKTYHENGVLKSEGNRKDFKLDDAWKFYDETGKLVLVINYSEGQKNGLRITYREQEFVEETFENDIKQGLTTTYYPDSTVLRTVNFVDGREDGLAKEFASDGRVITLTTYKKGFVVSRERINRLDSQNRKQGLWKFFHENGNIRLEGRYSNDLKDGYFKDYDTEGKLLSTTKWIAGEEQEAPVELARLEVVRDYYPTGRIMAMQTFRNGVPEGVRRNYDEEGNITSGAFYKDGKRVAEGITKADGVRHGDWKEFYANGTLKAEGKYENGVRVGDWKFYHDNGRLEQTGRYSTKGEYAGEWLWYYPSGNLRREESFLNGLSDGLMTEYDDDGIIITQGEYIEGMEEGEWILQYGDHREEGSFSFGLKSGYWKHFDDQDNLIFEGEFIDDNPNGRHIFYWNNGNVKDEINYLMGMKRGDWKRYNYDGTLLLVISYENGIEKKYDGVKITPEFTEPFDEPYDDFNDE